MPLSASNFVPLTGRIRASDMLNFFNLFTGVMTDQPVTFKNSLDVGGSQGQFVPPLKVRGATVPGGIDLIHVFYAPTDAQPKLALGMGGGGGWPRIVMGDGVSAPGDVELTRSAPSRLDMLNKLHVEYGTLDTDYVFEVASDSSFATFKVSATGQVVMGLAISTTTQPIMNAVKNNRVVFRENPSVAAAGTTNLFPDITLPSGLVLITAGVNNQAGALITCDGSGHVTKLLSGFNFGITAGASSFNVYWNGSNFVIQNNTGSTTSFAVWGFLFA